MKKTIILFLVAVTMAIPIGCADWLNVTPRSEKESEDLFSSEDGYRTALAGVYMLMRQSNLYGYSTTMFIPEYMARNWSLPTNQQQTAYLLANFRYGENSVKGLFFNTWRNYYKVIVQLNDIIEHVENSAAVFEGNNRRIVEGEAVGLRAFLHLDLLRYYGPVPVDADLTQKAIPYMDAVTFKADEALSISYKEVLECIERDLLRAEELLVDVDPIVLYSNSVLNGNFSEDEDIWLKRRQGRFNYYAVLATQARLQLWKGDKVKATNYAKQVVEATNAGTGRRFLLQNNFQGGLLMSAEHIFHLHIPTLIKDVQGAYRGSSYLTTTFYQLTTIDANPNIMNNLYETAVNGNDIRYSATQFDRLWEREQGGNNYYFYLRKYLEESTPGYMSKNVVPLIRISEMYLILAEAASTGEAAAYFTDIKKARNMDLTKPVTQVLRVDVEKEYRKEFIGEGQMFFFYKRHNYEEYPWPSRFILPVDGNPYVIPKPEEQTSFE